ncbi:mask, partial [Symbiodinium microadriaticum]
MTKRPLEPPPELLRVWKASGEEMASLPVEQLSDVKALKRYLEPLCGTPRFRQRLLNDGVMLDDGAVLNSPLDLQLVLLRFSDASDRMDTNLSKAAEEGMEALVEEILGRPRDPDFLGSETLPALWVASQRGHDGIVRLLLEAKANKDASHCRRQITQPNSRTTCIAVAAERGFVDVVRLLLDAGARQALPREGTTVYDTPLATAAAAGHLDTVRLLLETGVDKDMLANTNFKGRAPLAWAVQEGHLDIAQLLLDAEADANQTCALGSGVLLRGTLGRTPLVWSCEEGRDEQVRLLLGSGADKDRRGPCTPLGAAARRGHLSVVRLLLEAGANIEASHPNDGRAPLWLAAAEGHYD